METLEKPSSTVALFNALRTLLHFTPAPVVDAYRHADDAQLVLLQETATTNTPDSVTLCMDRMTLTPSGCGPGVEAGPMRWTAVVEFNRSVLLDRYIEHVAQNPVSHRDELSGTCRTLQLLTADIAFQPSLNPQAGSHATLIFEAR